MLFSSIPFLYYFLPLALTVYFLTPRRLKNVFLLVCSLFFYFWGEPVYLFLVVLSTLTDWLLGFVIDRWRGMWLSRMGVITSITLNLGLLGLFKYSDFFIENLNRFRETPIAALGLALPIGISFYSFQTLSYTVDLYRGQVKLQRNFINFAVYVTLFPQLVAGPIVRYATVERELTKRRHSVADFAWGARRFTIGLAKKVLIANVLGELCAAYKESGQGDVLYTWLYVVAFALHIYFDFSGYSDMAIGLGRIFGFRFLENFNYPYIARSAAEFWRRWHISLGSWFRDYLYIPLGGNRCKPARWVLNIVVVWFLTGFWHGAGWNFIIWGLYFACLLLLERFVLNRWLERLPKFAGRAYLLFAVLIGWMFFDADSLSQALGRIAALFGGGAGGNAGSEALYALRSYAVPLAIAVVGATPLPASVMKAWREGRLGGMYAVCEPLAVAGLLVACTAYLIDGSLNPFIYFRF